MKHNTTVLGYIEQKIIEWKEKTLSSQEHFQEELRKTLLEVAKFVEEHK